jgi:hypothetical protein
LEENSCVEAAVENKDIEEYIRLGEEKEKRLNRSDHEDDGISHQEHYSVIYQDKQFKFQLT